MLYVVLTMPTLNKAYLFIYLFIGHYGETHPKIFSSETTWPIGHNSPWIVPFKI
jgi:hypothetical protein